MTVPTISVIIPVRNGGEVFRRCLAAIDASTVRPHEVFVVDDGSTDESASLARQARATLLETESPGSGPAIARNLAATQATGDVLFFFDCDVEIRADTLARIQAGFKTDPSLAAMFGCYDDAPADPGFLSQYRNLFHHYIHQHGSENAATFWSGCGAIRRDIFQRCGGFSSNYALPSIEDIELGYAVRRKGYRIRLDKSLQVKHLKRWTLLSLLHSDIVARGIPWTRLLLREGAFLDDLNLQNRNRISVALIYLAALNFLLGFWQPAAWLAMTLVLMTVLWLNRHLYQFMAARHGGWFGLASIGPHWLYYFYNGISFSIGSLLHLIEREPKPGRRLIQGKHKRTFALVMGGVLTAALFLQVPPPGSWAGEDLWRRASATLAHVLVVALMYRFMGRVWGRGTATVAAALLAVGTVGAANLPHGAYSAFFSLLAFLSFHSLVRALKTNRYDSWISYGTTTSAYLAFTASAIPVLLAQVTATAIGLWLPPDLREKRNRASYFSLALGLAVLFAVVAWEARSFLGQRYPSAMAILAAISGGTTEPITGITAPGAADILPLSLALLGIWFALRHDLRFSAMLITWAVLPSIVIAVAYGAGEPGAIMPEPGLMYLAEVAFMAIGINAIGTALGRRLPGWKWASWFTVVSMSLLARFGQMIAKYDAFR